jgi:hypothetical protein
VTATAIVGDDDKPTARNLILLRLTRLHVAAAR